METKQLERKIKQYNELLDALDVLRDDIAETVKISAGVADPELFIWPYEYGDRHMKIDAESLCYAIVTTIENS